LDRIVDPVARSLNAKAAQALLKIRAGKAEARRMSALARKCNEGKLTPEERAEYEINVLAAELLALLQAQARALVHAANGK
jgi:hypothetical protein